MQEFQCDHLKELIHVETEVMKKHIANHKWFNHIPGENEGIIDFIEKYGWIMREMYCHYACPDRESCSDKDVPNVVREK